MNKKIRIVLAVVLLVAVAFALTQGPNNPGAGANNASAGSVAWTNTANVTANDNNGASAVNLTSLGAPTSQLLQATNFGFSIPANSTINGISVSVTKGFTGTNIWDNSLLLLKAGVATGTDKADTVTFWPGPLTACPGVATGWGTTSYGGAADLWGATWAPADINASNFGVQIQAQNKNSSASTACVDVATVTVTYTPRPSLLNLFSRAQRRTQTRIRGRG